VGWEGFEGLGTELGKPIQNTGTSLRKNAPGERDSRRSRLKGRKSRGEHSAQTHPPTSGNTFEPLLEDDDGMEDGSGEGDMSAWDSLNLSPETLSSLARMKFSQPTPIQVSALPHILAGNDAICKAPTGSGKTLGFGIPLREHFLQSQRTKAQSRLKNDHAPRDPPIALILSPTRELAYQLESHLRELTSDSNSICPRIATITGGKSMHKQQRLLATADIIIGTPGRLWEVIDGSLELQQSIKRVKFLVLDEADRLLSSGHFQEVEEILNALDRSDDDDSESGFRQERQTLVFSATFEKNLQQKLAGKSKSSGRDLGNGQSMEYLLKKLNFREEKPKFIDVNPSAQMAVGLREGIIECGETEKVLKKWTIDQARLICVGPISLLITSPPPSHPNIGFHQFGKLSPPNYISTPESFPSRVSHPRRNAPKSSFPLNRTLLIPIFVFHTHCYRCCCSRIGHSINPARRPLPCATNGRHVCAPFRPHSSGRAFRLEHLALRSRRGSRRTSSHCQGARS